LRANGGPHRVDPALRRQGGRDGTQKDGGSQYPQLSHGLHLVRDAMRDARSVGSCTAWSLPNRKCFTDFELDYRALVGTGLDYLCIRIRQLRQAKVRFFDRAVGIRERRCVIGDPL